MTNLKESSAMNQDIVSPDREFMARALQIAELAAGRTSPNPLVGCVIVKAGKIVGEGYHHQAGTPHAEVHALQAAGEQAKDADVYVTLEPCSHYGRTPPCADALIQAQVKRVVVALTDPNPLVGGRGLRKLQAAGITVEVGL
jgi:diaminohydroxyphosphoribosylaminopyrimidine deaminase/5-amino-6-(5-phosphoribosylamino)uracil reductase